MRLGNFQSRTGCATQEFPESHRDAILPISKVAELCYASFALLCYVDLLCYAMISFALLLCDALIFFALLYYAMLCVIAITTSNRQSHCHHPCRRHDLRQHHPRQHHHHQHQFGHFVSILLASIMVISINSVMSPASISSAPSPSASSWSCRQYVRSRLAQATCCLFALVL